MLTTRCNSTVWFLNPAGQCFNLHEAKTQQKAVNSRLNTCAKVRRLSRCDIARGLIPSIYMESQTIRGCKQRAKYIVLSSGAASLESQATKNVSVTITIMTVAFNSFSSFPPFSPASVQTSRAQPAPVMRSSSPAHHVSFIPSVHHGRTPPISSDVKLLLCDCVTRALPSLSLG